MLPSCECLVAFDSTDRFSLKGVNQSAFDTVAVHLSAEFGGIAKGRRLVVAVTDADIGIEYGDASAKIKRCHQLRITSSRRTISLTRSRGANSINSRVSGERRSRI